MQRVIRTGMVLAGGFMLSSLSSVAHAGPAGPISTPPAATLDYIGSVELRPDRGELSAGWTIQVLDGSLEEIRLALSSSFGTAQVSGPDMVQMSSELSADGSRRVYQIALSPKEARTDPERPRLIRFAYGGPVSLPPINSLDEKTVELTVESGWYPYEPGLMGRLTAQIGVQISGDWTPVTIDAAEAVGPGYRVRQTDPSFDISMSWLRAADLTAIEGYKIYDLRTEPGTKLPELKAALQECRAVFDLMVGPLPIASVLLTDRAYEAYSRGTLISLMDIENETDASLFKIVCHELSHHWSPASPGGPDDWINEGVAEYMALMAVRDRFGEVAFQAYLAEFEEALIGEGLAPIWTPHSKARPAYLVSYRAAPLALADLERRLGRASFLAFLKSILTDSIGTTPDLLDRLEQMAGIEPRAAFEARLME